MGPVDEELLKLTPTPKLVKRRITTPKRLVAQVQKAGSINRKVAVEDAFLLELISEKAPAELQQLLHEHLTKQWLFRDICSKLKDRVNPHVFILQCVPPSVVGIESPCAYIYCPKQVTPPGAFRLSLEPCKNLELERVPVLPLSSSHSPDATFRGWGKQQQSWFCLTCMEDLWHHIMTVGICDETALTKLLSSSRTESSIFWDQVTFKSSPAPSMTPDPYANVKSIKIKLPRPGLPGPKTLCGTCKSLRGRKKMIACQNRKVCKFGLYFHVTCAGAIGRSTGDCQEAWLCKKCAVDKDNHPRVIERQSISCSPTKRQKLADGSSAPRDGTMTQKATTFDYSGLTQGLLLASSLYSIPSDSSPLGRPWITQVYSMIYPETRYHDSQYFTLSHPQQHALWIWKNTITRQNMFERTVNLTFLKRMKLLRRFNLPLEDDEVDVVMQEIQSEPVGIDDEPPVRGFMNYGGYCVELSTVDVQDQHLSAVMRLSDRRCQKILQSLGDDLDFEPFVAKPKVWNSLRFKIAPKECMDVDDTDSQSETSSGTLHSTSSSDI